MEKGVGAGVSTSYPLLGRAGLPFAAIAACGPTNNAVPAMALKWMSWRRVVGATKDSELGASAFALTTNLLGLENARQGCTHQG